MKTAFAACFVLAFAACATAPVEPAPSSLLTPRCVPACAPGYRCIQLNNQPVRPILPPICIPN